MINEVNCKPIVPSANDYMLKQLAYRKLFTGEDGEAIIRDLINFCKWNDSTIANNASENAAKLALKGVLIHIDKMISSELISEQ